MYKCIENLITRLKSSNTVYAWINRQNQDAAKTIEDMQSEIDALNAQVEELKADAARFVWIVADHDDKSARLKCREILERLGSMSYASACVAIDAAIQQQKGEE